MEEEGRGHTSHHMCNWNSRQEHQGLDGKTTSSRSLWGVDEVTPPL